MIQTLVYFSCACICGLAQYGSLLLNMDTKDRIWKVGIYVGMGASGWAAMGFLVPKVNPFPCLVFFVGTAVMLTSVILSYYLLPIPDSYTAQQREDLGDARHSTLRQLGVGIGFAVVLATVVAYMQGQQQGQVVQQGFADVVYKLADEVKSLHNAVNVLTGKVNKLEQKADQSARNDSLARKQSFKNQQQLLKQSHRN